MAHTFNFIHTSHFCCCAPSPFFNLSTFPTQCSPPTPPLPTSTTPSHLLLSLMLTSHYFIFSSFLFLPCTQNILFFSLTLCHNKTSMDIHTAHAHTHTRMHTHTHTHTHTHMHAHTHTSHTHTHTHAHTHTSHTHNTHNTHHTNIYNHTCTMRH